MPNNTICLNMIVKNEAHVIEKTLNNIIDKIPITYWVICDTGSTDQTIDIITNFFKNKQIEGELHEDKWVNFGFNRTKALNYAFDKTDYLFIFDADDKIEGTVILPDDLFIFNRYDFIFSHYSITFNRPLLVNNRLRWEFLGVLHEYLYCADYQNKSTIINGNCVIIPGLSRNIGDAKNYLKDAQLLEKSFYEDLEKPNKGLSNRYSFYCAQSYRDGGDVINAIKWYLKCLECNGWVQEKYYSCIMLGDLYKKSKNINDAIKYWKKSVIYDNERIECIVRLMDYCIDNNDFFLVNLLYHKYKNYKLNNYVGKLFIINDNYNDIIEYYNSISAYYCGESEKKNGYECCKNVIINDKIKRDMYIRTCQNLFFYKSCIKNDKDNNDLYLKLANVLGLLYDNILDTYAYDKNTSKKNSYFDKLSIDEYNKIYDTWSLLLNKNYA